MLQLKSLRIGAKLAISASVGLIIAATMIVVQYRVAVNSHAPDERARANDVVQGSSRIAGEAVRQAQVLSSARSLPGESRHLKTEVEEFLSTVRAA